jgi:hypothetical protein
MAKLAFEHKITKYEVERHCLLLRDDGKKDFGPNFDKSPKLFVRCGNKTYTATVNEYYVDNKFFNGIHFDANNEMEKKFFFEQSIMAGHIAKIETDPDEALVDGRQAVDINISILTKQ